MDYKSKGSLYSYSDTLKFQERIINKWKPVTDVWALRYGDSIMGCLSTFGSLYITHFFRRDLKIRPFATLTCYIPVIGISAIAVTVFHTCFITKDILNYNSCSPCVIIKSGIGQVLSLGYTLTAAPIVCFYVADRLLTYPVPPLRRAPKEVFHLYQKIVTKYKRSLSFIGVFYMIAACFITSQKYKNLETLDIKTRK